MTKLEMAHDWAMQSIDTGYVCETETLVSEAWKYADAMQAKAEKRSDMERPAVLQDEWQPDWSVAPDDATAWEYLGYGGARWHTTKDGFFKVAPIFDQPYYGDMFFIKRP